MSEEMKQLSDEIGKVFTRLDEIKKDSDTNDVLVKEEQDKLVKSLVEQKGRLDSMEAAIQRTSNFVADAKSKDDEEQRKAFAEWARDKKGGSNEIEIKALRTDSQPDGGYFVRPDFANFISQRVFESSPLAELANTVTISGNELNIIVDDDEAGSGWAQELPSTVDTTTPQIRNLKVPVHTLRTEPVISDEMLEDGSIDVEAWLQGKVANKFGRTIATALIAGNGVGKPRGLISYPDTTAADSYEFGKIERVPSGAASAVTTDGFITLQNRVKEPYQPNSVWLMKRGTFGDVLKLKSANNYHFLGLQPADRQGIVSMTILGKPVRFADDMEENGTGTNIIVAYGDYRQGYTYVIKNGLFVLRDPYSTTGGVKYKVRQRVGGDVTNFDAFKVMDVAAS